MNWSVKRKIEFSCNLFVDVMTVHNQHAFFRMSQISESIE